MHRQPHHPRAAVGRQQAGMDVDRAARRTMRNRPAAAAGRSPPAPPARRPRSAAPHRWRASRAAASAKSARRRTAGRNAVRLGRHLQRADRRAGCDHDQRHVQAGVAGSPPGSSRARRRGRRASCRRRPTRAARPRGPRTDAGRCGTRPAARASAASTAPGRHDGGHPDPEVEGADHLLVGDVARCLDAG